MCGICGIYDRTEPLAQPNERLGRMVSALWHRGPDARGEHVTERVALGATRLAIIDLIGGDQPIYSEDGSVCAVYNGEIYNYRELRGELEARGHDFASRTDSEVLVHLYEEEGIHFVRRLNGMFAFALWDERRQCLHLARDRFGIKPLHYSWDGRQLRFASEVKALLAENGARASLDLDAYVELLTFQNVLSDRTLFSGVRLLPAASVLTVDADGLEVRRFWDPMPMPSSQPEGPALATEVRAHFERAVERHLVSDVEIASYLSGGLDTGAVSAVAARRLPRLTTFSTGFDVSTAAGLEAEFDERADAAQLAAVIGTHHHELLLDAAEAEMVLPRMMRYLEEPRMSFSYPNYLTAGLASRWVKVVLSGAGGDEMLGGYPWRYGFAARPDFPEGYYDYWTRLLDADEMAGALAPSAQSEIDLSRPRAVFDALMAESEHLEPLDRTLYFESRTFLHGLLVIEDKLSMAHSLETRVPFLDNELVDFLLTVPAARKLEEQRSKDLFRKAVSGLLPEPVVARKKTGFVPPQAAWFRGEQSAYLEAILLSDRTLERGVLRPEFVRRVVEEHFAGAADRRLLLWTLLCMEWWHRVFVDGEHAG
jgi:asparagine synthase (glutamine-hydrolysing)